MALQIVSAKYVIVGGGVAGGYAVRQLVNLGAMQGEIMLISAEQVLPYERPALSKGALLGKAKLPGFHTCAAEDGSRGQDWYDSHGIIVMLGTFVERTDLANKVLYSASHCIQFEKLLICTGATISYLPPSYPNHNATNIFYLRQIHEMQAIRNHVLALDAARPEGAPPDVAVIIGAGYIGCEISAVTCQLGLHTVLVTASSHIMARVLVPEIAQLYEDFYTALGIEIVKQENLDCFEVNDRGEVKEVKLRSGKRIECKLVVVGLGSAIDNSLWKGQLEQRGSGIKVDGFMQTSMPDVFAAGDIVNFKVDRYAQPARVEHVVHARRSAEQAVRSMMSVATAEYDYLPFSYTRVFSLSWKFWGTATHARCVMKAEGDPGKWMKVFAIWYDMNYQATGCFIESGSEEDENVAKNIANEQPVVNLKVLQACQTVAEVLEASRNALASWRDQTGTAYKYVILGGGVAGGYAANEFQKAGVGPHEVLLISAENVLPYERPSLTKAVMQGKADIPGIHTCAAEGQIHTQEWYEQNGIDTWLETKVVSADFQKKMLWTASRGAVTFEKLICATGSSPIKLDDVRGSDTPGVCVVRSLQDVRNAWTAIEDVPKPYAVVVGAGFIGMECAASLTQRGVTVTVICPSAFVMSRILPPEIAMWYEMYYGARGVRFIKNSTCVGFKSGPSTHGRGTRVQSVSLMSGDVIPADLVIIGVGATIDRSLYRSQLACEGRGVKVDAYMRTSMEGVYACGDIVAFPVPRYRHYSVMEHVTHARKSAVQAVKHMTGQDPPPYDYLPFFYSRIFNLSWKLWGEVRAERRVIVNMRTMVMGDRIKIACIFWEQPIVDSEKKTRVIGMFTESCSDEEEQIAKQAVEMQPRIDPFEIYRCDTVENLIGLLRHIMDTQGPDEITEEEAQDMQTMDEHTLTRPEVSRMLQTFPRDEYAYLSSGVYDEDMRALFREHASGTVLLSGDQLTELVLSGAPQYRRPGIAEQIEKEGMQFLLSIFDHSASAISETSFPAFMKVCLAYPVYLYFNKPTASPIVPFQAGEKNPHAHLTLGQGSKPARVNRSKTSPRRSISRAATKDAGRGGIAKLAEQYLSEMPIAEYQSELPMQQYAGYKGVGGPQMAADTEDLDEIGAELGGYPGGAGGTNMVGDHLNMIEATLQKLKSWADLGLITQEELGAKRAECLRQLSVEGRMGG